MDPEPEKAMDSERQQKLEDLVQRITKLEERDEEERRMASTSKVKARPSPILRKVIEEDLQIYVRTNGGPPTHIGVRIHHGGDEGADARPSPMDHFMMENLGAIGLTQSHVKISRNGKYHVFPIEAFVRAAEKFRAKFDEQT